MSKVESKPTDIRRIFVYGSLRRGQYNHSKAFEKGITHVCDGQIKGAELVGGNAYPWIVESKDTKSKVIGEVYDLDNTTFNWVNAMELGAGYELHPVEVEHKGGPTKAFAYFYGDPHRLEGMPRVASGDWAQRDEA